jgi:ArsR family transcriptional regulator
MRLRQAAYVFHALSDPTRIRIFNLLLQAGSDLAVGELVDALEERQYNVSKHLRILKTAGLVTERREGRFVLYGVAHFRDSLLLNVCDAIRHLPEEDLRRDREELVRRLLLRADGRTTVGLAKPHLASGRRPPPDPEEEEST